MHCYYTEATKIASMEYSASPRVRSGYDYNIYVLQIINLLKPVKMSNEECSETLGSQISNVFTQPRLFSGLCKLNLGI